MADLTKAELEMQIVRLKIVRESLIEAADALRSRLVTVREIVGNPECEGEEAIAKLRTLRRILA